MSIRRSTRASISSPARTGRPVTLWALSSFSATVLAITSSPALECPSPLGARVILEVVEVVAQREEREPLRERGGGSHAGEAVHPGRDPRGLRGRADPLEGGVERGHRRPVP